MSLSTAFLLAILTGVIAGAAVVRVRKMMLETDESTVLAMLCGGTVGALTFGTTVVFDQGTKFMLFEQGATPPGGALEFTVVAVVLIALVFLIYPK